ncbi:hypothetical protein PtB15_3B200 [Puccinia triticina]|nr:hypothetical protein PtB15_3B200 [Puccinia triticina]
MLKARQDAAAPPLGQQHAQHVTGLWVPVDTPLATALHRGDAPAPAGHTVDTAPRPPRHQSGTLQ